MEDVAETGTGMDPAIVADMGSSDKRRLRGLMGDMVICCGGGGGGTNEA